MNANTIAPMTLEAGLRGGHLHTGRALQSKLTGLDVA